MSGDWVLWWENQRESVRITLMLLCVVVLEIVLLLALRSITTMRLDPHATNAPRPSMLNERELRDSLQAQAEEERFRLKLNGAPIFNMDGEGDLLLQNPLENEKNIQVLITLDDTGEEVYKSAVLPPGAQELRVVLFAVPPPGTYAATAEIWLLDAVSEQPTGSMTAQLAITITEAKISENEV